MLSHTNDLHVESNSDVVDGARTPLLHACFEGHTEIVQTLLQHPSVVVSCTDELGFNPLHASSWEGHVDIVNLLLRDGRINPQDKTKHAYQHDDHNQEGSTPLMLAANNGNDQAMRALIKDGRSDLDQTWDGMHLIHLAARNGHAKVVRTLLDIGIDVNVRMKDGTTALYLAAEYGRVAVVKVLLKDQRVNKKLGRLSDGATPLVVATWNVEESKNQEHKEVRLLLQGQLKTPKYSIDDAFKISDRDHDNLLNEQELSIIAKKISRESVADVLKNFDKDDSNDLDVIELGGYLKHQVKTQDSITTMSDFLTLYMRQYDLHLSNEAHRETYLL